MTHARSVTWLKIGAIAFELFGVLTILSLVPALNGLFTPLIQLATLDGSAAFPYEAKEVRFLVAVLGGVTIGLGSAIWMITTQVYVEDPAKGTPLLLVPVSAWFLADGLGSIMAGVPFNAVLNISFLALIVVPVMASRRKTVTA